MPLRSYGVLTARVVDRRREDHDDSPHFLAFQSQAWHTDDVAGHALDGIDAPTA